MKLGVLLFLNELFRNSLPCKMYIKAKKLKETRYFYSLICVDIGQKELMCLDYEMARNSYMRVDEVMCSLVFT
jgi:hypothetical protein